MLNSYRIYNSQRSNTVIKISHEVRKTHIIHFCYDAQIKKPSGDIRWNYQVRSVLFLNKHNLYWIKLNILCKQKAQLFMLVMLLTMQFGQRLLCSKNVTYWKSQKRVQDAGVAVSKKKINGGACERRCLALLSISFIFIFIFLFFYIFYVYDTDCSFTLF